MPLVLVSFACGFIFGAGLLISGMTDTAKVLGFLDIFGAMGVTCLVFAVLARVTR